MAAGRHLSTDAFVLRTGLFYAVSYVLIGVHLPVFPVWLQAKGLDPGQVGAILAATALVRVVSVPAATRTADRHFGLRAVMIACAAATAAGFICLGMASHAAAILALTVATAFAHTPGMALLDAYALRGLRARGRAYGPVRLWGSASFIVANLGAGIAFDLIEPGHLVWLIAASAVAIAFLSLSLLPLPAPPQPAAASPDARPLWRDTTFLAVLTGASLIQSSHAVYYGFATIAWRAAGLDGVAIGALWATGVIAEIVLFAVSARLPFQPLVLLVIGAAGAVVRWTAMAFDPPGWTLPLLQCLHALSFGAAHLGAVGFIAQAAPEGRAATAQGYYSVMQGVALSGCMLLAGLLYEAVGVASYAAMALAAFAGGAPVAQVWLRTARR